MGQATLMGEAATTGRVAGDAGDLELLRRHEPLLRFTHGELFYPMAAEAYVSSCDLLEGTTLRDASVVIPAGTLDLERLAAAGDAPPGHSQFLRFVPKPLGSIELGAVAEPPRPADLLGTRPARAGRAPGPSRRRRPGRVAVVAWPRAGRHDRRRFTALRGDPQPRPARRVPRPGRPRRPMGRAPLHVPVRDERLALDVRGRQRSRGGLGAVLRRAARRSTTVRSGRPGSAPLPTTRRVTTSGVDGTTRGSRSSTAIRWSSRRRLARDLSRAGRVHHAAALPGRAQHPRPARPASAGSGATRSTSPTPATSPRMRSAHSASRSSTTPAATGSRSAPAATSPGRRSSSATMTAGSTATTASGGSTRATGSPASARRRARSTPGSAPSASRGTTRSASRGSTRWRRRRRPSPRWRSGSPSSSPNATTSSERPPSSSARSRCARPSSGRSARRPGQTRIAPPGSPSCASRRHGWRASAARPSSSTTAIDAGRRRAIDLRAGVRDDPRAHLRHAAEPEAPVETNRRALAEIWAAVSVGLLVVALAVILWFRILPPLLVIVVLLGSYLAIESFFRRDVRDPAAPHLDRAGHRQCGDPRLPVPPRGAAGRPACARSASHRRQPRSDAPPPGLTGVSATTAPRPASCSGRGGCAVMAAL